MATLPKQITKTLYIAVDHHNAKNNSKIQENEVYIFDSDMSKHGYVTLKKQTIIIKFPEEIDLIDPLLKNLNLKKIEKLKEIEIIEEEISNLQALPAPAPAPNTDYSEYPY